MPIRFSGSAKPRKLKSPDPINMPSVRENIVPRIKAEVAYYKDNGELPSVTPPWGTLSEFLTIPSPGSRGADCVVIDDDIMALQVGDVVNSVYFYKWDGSVWQLTDTISLTNCASGQTAFDRDNACIFVGRPLAASNSGQTLKYGFDFSTGTVTTGSTVCSDLTTASAYEGRQIVVYKDLVITSAPHWRPNSNPGNYAGLIGYRSRSEPVNTRATITHNLYDSSTYTSGGISGNQFPNDDLLVGHSMHVDGNRLLVLAAGSRSENSGKDGFLSVFEYDENNAEMTEVQRIPNPYPSPGNNYRPVCVRGQDGTMLMVCTGSKEQDNINAFSIVEYTWNGSEYVQDSWYTLPDEIYTAVQNRSGLIYNITMISKTEILIPYQDGSDRIIKVTK